MIYFKKGTILLAKICIESESLKGFIKSKFTVKNPNERFSEYAPKKLSCITPTFRVPYGMIFDIIRVAKQYNPKVNVSFDSFTKKKIFPLLGKEKITDLIQPENSKFTYRNYQEESILKGLHWGAGLFNLATSSGKSLIIYGLIINLWKMLQKESAVLILVPNIQLVEQMKKDFIEYGCDESKICQFSGFSPNPEWSQIIISNRQYLQNHDKELPKNIEILIVDEAHGLSTKNSNVTRFVRYFDTNIHFGFSGSFPEDDPIQFWNIKGILGPQLIKRTAEDLQKEGYVSKIRITTLEFIHGRAAQRLITPPEYIEQDGKTIQLNQLERAKMKYPLEWNYCECCDFTNNFIGEFTYLLKENSILLFDHVQHGLELKTIIENFNYENQKKIYFIDGSIPLDYRENVRKEMEENSNCILLANTGCFKMGINIKNIHNILFSFSAGRAAAKIIQSIGRGLRLHPNKKAMKLYDFYHNFDYSSEHAAQRKKLYDKNYDYGEKIFKKYIEVN